MKLPRVVRRLVEGLPRAGRVRRYFIAYLRPHTGSLMLGLLLGGVVAASEVLRPWPLQLVFDGVFGKHKHHVSLFGINPAKLPPLTVILAAAGAMLLISAIGGLAAYGQTVLLSGAGQRIVARIRRDLFRHLMTLPPLFHAQRQQGDLVMRLTGDIVLVRELLVGNLLDACAAALTLAGTLVVMFWVEPRLTLVSLAIVPLVSVASAALSGRIRQTVVRARDKEGGLASQAGEALGAIALLQAFNATGRIAERFERDNRSGLRANLKGSRLEAIFTRALDLLTSAGLGVTLGLGAWSVFQGRMTPGQLLVFLAYQRTLYRPIRQMARLASRTAKSSACGERIIDILETESDITDRPDARPCPRVEGEIRFENVSMRYPRGDEALVHFDALVPAGSTVIVRGESGAGKTTLISLLPRLLDPTQGRVLIDGHDVKSLTLESLRRQVAIVFQDSVLLGLTLRENIELGRLDASPEEVEEAARRAGVLRFALELPQGLDTIVGERGALLSGGQRQRVALARAALRDAPILVLDEPFAHLDAANRAHVVEALEASAVGRTVVLVTHDSDAGLEADLEWVLDRGRLVECHARKEPATRRNVIPLARLSSVALEEAAAGPSPILDAAAGQSFQPFNEVGP